jgi:ribosomal protein S18 acetylase RimI-like enzyme
VIKKIRSLSTGIRHRLRRQDHRGRIAFLTFGQKMKIRPANLLDVEDLVSLNGHVQSIHAAAVPSFFRNQPPAFEAAGAFRRMLEDPAAVLLIAEERLACGYLYAQFHDRPENWFRPAFRVCNLSHLSVHPDARRKGVARRLIAAIVAEAEKRGFARIELDVWSFNHDARAAFRQLGFQVFNERMELKRADQAPEPAAAVTSVDLHL